jgi:hypothetical protein
MSLKEVSDISAPLKIVEVYKRDRHIRYVKGEIGKRDSRGLRTLQAWVTPELVTVIYLLTAHSTFNKANYLDWFLRKYLLEEAKHHENGHLSLDLLDILSKMPPLEDIIARNRKPGRQFSKIPKKEDSEEEITPQFEESER